MYPRDHAAVGGALGAQRLFASGELREKLATYTDPPNRI